MIELIMLLIDFIVSFVMLFLNIEIADGITLGQLFAFLAVLMIFIRIIFYRKMGED